MYRFWEPVIEPLLRLLEPELIVEIGSDQGHNTRNLLQFCRETGAILHAIDPLPKFDVDEWERAYPNTVVFHLDTSLNALPELDRPGAVLIDGDHNWYTVFHELKLLEQLSDAEGFPLVLLHDIGWPYGRRDLYYEPDRIPEPFRQPNRMSGMHPDRRGLEREGGLNSHLFNAMQEGGPRNGVLTAVEDFIRETTLDIEFLKVPAINGLGVLLPTGLETSNPDLAELLAELRNTSVLPQMLERVESRRIEALVELADRRLAQDKSQSRIADLEERLASLRKQHEQTVSDHNIAFAQLRIRINALTQERDHIASQSKRLRQEERSHDRAIKTRDHRIEERNKRIEQIERDREKLLGQMRRLKSRRSVRLALWVASRFGRLFSVWRRSRSALKPSRKASGTSLPAATRSNTPDTNKTEDRDRAHPQQSQASTADVVVCVHNAEGDVRACLDSIVETTNLVNHGLILVDDGSAPSVRRMLQEFSSRYPVRLIRNDESQGYTVAANQGIAASERPHVVLLNSDTIVGSGWLEKLIHCAEAMPDAGVVGPYSNAASWQSVPELTNADGTWNLNPLPPGKTPRDIAAEVERWSPRLYPELSLINGFCYLITREALEKVGTLDEQRFPRGYAEEDDFSIRCNQAGLKLYVADDCYVYHAKSRSHTSEGRAAIVEQNRAILAEKHGADTIRTLVNGIQRDEELIRSRTFVSAALETSHREVAEPDLGNRQIRVGWVQPHLAEAGGIRRAIEMTNRLSRWGLKTVLIVPDGWETSWLPILSDVVSIEQARSMEFDHLILSDPDMVWPFMELDAEERTIYHLAPYMLYRKKDQTLDAYYSLPDTTTRQIANSKWTAEQVHEYTGISVGGIFPGGVDRRLFHPMRLQKTQDVVCHGSPREHKGTDTIEEACFDMRLLKMHGLGNSQHELAGLINSGRVFVSAAWHEGFNLAALEAMACGVPVVMTDDGGSTEYAVHEENALIVEPRNSDALRQQILRIRDDQELRTLLIENGIHTASSYDWDTTTADFAHLLFS